MAKPDDTSTDAAQAASPRRSERARAARYLDLWERNLSQSAVQGTPPAPPGPRVGRTPASEE